MIREKVVEIEDEQIKSSVCITQAPEKEKKQYFLQIREDINRHIERAHQVPGKIDSKCLILRNIALILKEGKDN